jgi:hypothetical protein
MCVYVQNLTCWTPVFVFVQERAAQMNPNSATADTSPSKSLSPKKASAAMKAVQEQLVHKMQTNDMAERIRQERMAELQSIGNRWKNGILKDGEQESGTEEVGTHRHMFQPVDKY